MRIAEGVIVLKCSLPRGPMLSKMTRGPGALTPCLVICQIISSLCLTAMKLRGLILILTFEGQNDLGGWVNQAYSRLSTTHGHITDCKLDSVVYAGVCVVI